MCAPYLRYLSSWGLHLCEDTAHISAGGRWWRRVRGEPELLRHPRWNPEVGQMCELSFWEALFRKWSQILRWQSSHMLKSGHTTWPWKVAGLSRQPENNFCVTLRCILKIAVAVCVTERLHYKVNLTDLLTSCYWKAWGGKKSIWKLFQWPVPAAESIIKQ